MSTSAEDGQDASEFGAVMARQATAERPAARLATWSAERERRAAGTERELSEAALERQKSFTRDSEELGTLLVKESARLTDRFDAGNWSLFDHPGIPDHRDLLHVFGPDVTGGGGSAFYRESWGSVEGFPGAGTDSRPDPKTGHFSASHYSTGTNQGSSYAGIGVRFTPRLHLCTLSVRPLVQWSGYDILAHRQYDPDLEAHAWASSLGAIGLHVQSRSASGGPVHTDARRWQNMWDRSELDPSTNRDYDGTEDSRTLSLDDVFATDEREVLVWVSCRAFSLSQSVFNLDTRASSAISCFLPYLVVEEIPLA